MVSPSDELIGAAWNTLTANWLVLLLGSALVYKLIPRRRRPVSFGIVLSRSAQGTGGDSGTDLTMRVWSRRQQNQELNP